MHLTLLAYLPTYLPTYLILPGDRTIACLCLGKHLFAFLLYPFSPLLLDSGKDHSMHPDHPPLPTTSGLSLRLLRAVALPIIRRDLGDRPLERLERAHFRVALEVVSLGGASREGDGLGLIADADDCGGGERSVVRLERKQGRVESDWGEGVNRCERGETNSVRGEKRSQRSVVVAPASDSRTG